MPWTWKASLIRYASVSGTRSLRFSRQRECLKPRPFQLLFSGVVSGMLPRRLCISRSSSSLRFQHTLDLLVLSRHTSTHFTRYAYHQPQTIHPLRIPWKGARPAHASIRFSGRRTKKTWIEDSKESSRRVELHYE